jgi:hypothetical protein
VTLSPILLVIPPLRNLELLKHASSVGTLIVLNTFRIKEDPMLRLQVHACGLLLMCLGSVRVLREERGRRYFDLRFDLWNMVASDVLMFAGSFP